MTRLRPGGQDEMMVLVTVQLRYTLVGAARGGAFILKRKAATPVVEA